MVVRTSMKGLAKTKMLYVYVHQISNRRKFILIFKKYTGNVVQNPCIYGKVKLYVSVPVLVFVPDQLCIASRIRSGRSNDQLPEVVYCGVV